MARHPDSFRDFVLEQLSSLPLFRAQDMFGGMGLYASGVFFAIIHEGRLYFKVSPSTATTYKKAGMEPFRPGNKMTLSSFYEVPVEILESRPELIAWAQKAIEVAATKTTSSKKPRKRN
jgi:DNA transformation protein and related proteins